MDRTPWILIDYDDTLGGVLIEGTIQNNELAYVKALDKYDSLMESMGYNGNLARKEMEELDIHFSSLHGFSYRDRFKDTMKVSYIKHCNSIGEEWQRDVVAEIDRIGESVFQYPYMPLPGALHTLRCLRLNHRIAIVTKGNFSEQARKLTQSGVEHFIDAYYPVGHKNKADWEHVIHDLGIQDELSTTWAIGNSPKSDINVPLSLGMNAIWVKKGRWVFEHEEIITTSAKYHEVDSIEEVLTYIKWS